MSQQGGSQWRRRYAERATTWRERQAWQVVWAGGIEWDPAGPYGPGIDGASYTPGWIEDGKSPLTGAVLLIKTRAITELIRGWDSYGQMQDWLASRGTTGSGGLVAPPAARRARCVAEETVLSHMLGHTEHVTAIGAYLPPWTWTSDVRHDLAAAMLTVARTGRRHAFAEHVAIALEDRAASIPAGQLRAYGGRGLRWALLYLARLDETPVAAEAARAAATGLRVEDAQATSRAARRRSDPGPRRVVDAAALPRGAVAAAEFRLPAHRLGSSPST
jgi:hypothetical protein